MAHKWKNMYEARKFRFHFYCALFAIDYHTNESQMRKV